MNVQKIFFFALEARKDSFNNKIFIKFRVIFNKLLYIKVKNIFKFFVKKYYFLF